MRIVTKLVCGLLVALFLRCLVPASTCTYSVWFLLVLGLSNASTKREKKQTSGNNILKIKQNPTKIERSDYISMEKLPILHIKLQVKSKNTCVFPRQAIAGAVSGISGDHWRLSVIQYISWYVTHTMQSFHRENIFCLDCFCIALTCLPQ